jgi:hypothetical protein
MAEERLRAFIYKSHLRINKSAGRQWLSPVLLTTQETEIRRIMVRSQPRKIVRETLS